MQEHNEVLLDRTLLTTVLNDLSSRLLQAFGFAVHLVIHGGAVMVLHNKLNCRPNTRDVDYCHRSFVTDLSKRGVYDASDKLNACIIATAQRWGLGADWMNAHADVALPMAIDPSGKYVDPIYNDAMHPSNVAMNTVYRSGGLVLVGVTWAWAVALKLVRYEKYDPSDIAAILALGQCSTRGLQWSRQILEGWLRKFCSPMGYGAYPPYELEKTRMKMRDAIKRAHFMLPMSSTPPYAMPYTTTAALNHQVPVIPGASVHITPAEAYSDASDDVRKGRGVLDTKTPSHARARSASRAPLRAIQPAAPLMPVPQIPGMPTMPSARPMSVSSDPLPHRRRRSQSISAAARPKSMSSMGLPPNQPPPPVPALPSYLMPSATASSRPSSLHSSSGGVTAVAKYDPQLPAGFIPYVFFPNAAPAVSAY